MLNRLSVGGCGRLTDRLADSQTDRQADWQAEQPRPAETFPLAILLFFYTLA